MNSNVLVTGADGQLALCIKKLYKNTNNGITFNFVSKQELDISKPEDISDQLSKNNYKYLINCAAYTKVDEAEDNPEAAFRINANAVDELARACDLYNVVLIQLSTDYVFDGRKTDAYTLEDTPNPINVYGASKLAGEHNIKKRLKAYYIVRASWLYSNYARNFLNTVIRNIELNNDLNIIETQKGCPTSCYELARFIFFIVEEDSLDFGLYHFGTINSTNWYEFARQIASYFPQYDQSKIKAISAYPSKAERPANSVLSIKETAAVYDRFETWENGLDKVMKMRLSK